MYVVVEWNQASHQPRLYGDEVYDRAALAKEIAADAFADAQMRGRRERYTVHAVDEDPRWESDNP